MPEEKFEVIFYQQEDETAPALEFINGCEKKMQAKIISFLEILQEKGYQLREPYSKLIGDDIFELRVKQGSDISRVFYFFYVGKKIVLTNGFIKKTRKTPKGEFEKAKTYRNQFLKNSSK